MSKDTFFITTAIDYTNGPPHIGHAYEKLLADVITRYRRARGEKAYFLTGVDQHGQKVQQSAGKEGVEPQEFADRIAGLFVDLWERMDVRYDGWASTTHPHHKAVVQTALQKLHDEGQLYKAAHTGFYSIRQEQFLTDKDRNEDGQFGPEWGEVQELQEENWYFKLQEHIPWLKDFILSHPDFIFPAFRAKEVLNALENSDSDLCISRPKTRLSWGIEFPFDPDYVTFVWFDALTNYISFAGYLADDVGAQGLEAPDFSKLWPADIHLIGKDIMIPAHAIYWPIMLHALGFSDEAMPKLVVHGFWNDKRGEKFSKSEGNVIDPHVRIDKIGTDALRYYLMKAIATGKDADFNDDRITENYNTDLANDLGNLLNRTLNMAKRYRKSVVTVTNDYDDELNRDLRTLCLEIPEAVDGHMKTWQVHLALEEIWKLVTHCNQYVDKCEPWKLAKDEEQATRLDTILQHLAEAMLHIAIHIAPIMPGASRNMREQLKFEGPDPFPLSELTWGTLKDGHQMGKPVPLFPRLETEEATA